MRGHFDAGKDDARLVLAAAEDGALLLQLPASQVRWPAAWGPVSTADLGALGSLELLDAPAWSQALDRSGARTPLAARMESRWRTFAVVALVAAALLFAFWRWGTPWAAASLARHVPLDWELALSTRALADLDGGMLKPSKLPAARQAQLRAGFQDLLARSGAQPAPYPGYRPRVELAFRSGLGANALALPGGQIVVTDGLVEAAARRGLPDDAVLGVLAHELGHVLHRHTTRLLVEQAVLNVGFGLALGDVSTLASMGGSLLTGLAYRRGHEQEADCYALALMAAAGRTTRPMAELLLHLDPGGGAELLASHPDTPGRAQRLRDGVLHGC